MQPEKLTTKQAALALGVTTCRVRQLAHRINVGVKIGRDWLFSPEDIKTMRARNTRRGQPRKEG